MSFPLRLLLIEDSEDDAALVVRTLRRGGYDLTNTRVETAEAMSDALARHPWDLVISDYSMPQFAGPAALGLLHEIGSIFHSSSYLVRLVKRRRWPR